MLKANLHNGETLSFDLHDADDVRRWTELAQDHATQARITALSITHGGVVYSLPRPVGFVPLFMTAEGFEPDSSRRIKGGEKILCNAGEVGIVLTVHSAQRAVRVDVTRQGKQRYNPRAR